jgi:hypothetical protein
MNVDNIKIVGEGCRYIHGLPLSERKIPAINPKKKEGLVPASC